MSGLFLYFYIMSIEDLYNLYLKCSGISTDSRFIRKDELFLSLKGPNFNGNKYAKKAIENGCTITA